MMEEDTVAEKLIRELEKVLGNAEGTVKVRDSQEGTEEDPFLLAAKNTRALCEALNVETSSFDVNTWIAKLYNLKQQGDRIIYSSVSDYIYPLDETTCSRIRTNLQRATIEEKAKDDKSMMKVLLKLTDHIELAGRQRDFLEERVKAMDKVMQTRMKEIVEEKTRNVKSELIGLVALFTALAFVSFGGIASLENVLNVVAANVPALKTALIVIFWMFCMMNLLFIFMYFVLRVIWRKEIIYEKTREMLVKRYPVIFASNYVLLVILTTTGLMYLAQKLRLYDLMKECTLEVCGILYVILFIASVGVLYKIGSDLWSDYKK